MKSPVGRVGGSNHSKPYWYSLALAMRSSGKTENLKQIYSFLKFWMITTVQLKNSLMKVDPLNDHEFDQSHGGATQSGQLGGGTYARKLQDIHIDQWESLTHKNEPITSLVRFFFPFTFLYPQEWNSDQARFGERKPGIPGFQSAPIIALNMNKSANNHLHMDKSANQGEFRTLVGHLSF